MRHGLSAADVLEVTDAGNERNPAERAALLICSALEEASGDWLNELGLGERDAHLLDLRSRTYGDTLSARITCPGCGITLAVRISREELGLLVGGEDRPHRTVIKLGQVEVSAQSPDGVALLRAASEPDVSAARSSLIRDCILEAKDRGRLIDPLELPDPVLEDIGEAIVASDPRVEVRVDLTCATCAHQWTPVLDIALFFWQELRATSVQVLDDVHALATGYGWSEDQVLSLTARRRRRYVERLVSE